MSDGAGLMVTAYSFGDLVILLPMSEKLCHILYSSAVERQKFRMLRLLIRH